MGQLHLEELVGLVELLADFRVHLLGLVKLVLEHSLEFLLALVVLLHLLTVLHLLLHLLHLVLHYNLQDLLG
jgi:hypothetical protein